MEQRLEAIRDTLAKQKEKRGVSESVWKGAQATRGSLTSYATDVLAKKKSVSASAASTASKKKGYGGVAEQANVLHQQVEQVVMGRLERMKQIHETSSAIGGTGGGSEVCNVAARASPTTSSSTTNTSKNDLSTAMTFIKPTAPQGPPPAKVVSYLFNFSHQGAKSYLRSTHVLM
jgi:hypothetical protein